MCVCVFSHKTTCFSSRLQVGNIFLGKINAGEKQTFKKYIGEYMGYL